MKTGLKRSSSGGRELSAMRILIVNEAGILICTMEVHPSDLIKEIKEKFEETQQVPPDSQTLMFKGQHLEDSNDLTSYSIHEGSSINVLITPKNNILHTDQWVDAILSLENSINASFNNKQMKGILVAMRSRANMRGWMSFEVELVEMYDRLLKAQGSDKKCGYFAESLLQKASGEMFGTTILVKVRDFPGMYADVRIIDDSS